MKMNEEGRKRLKDSIWIIEGGVPLSVGFVPLCGPSPLMVRCPMCSLVMSHNGTEYFCAECGIRG